MNRLRQLITMAGARLRGRPHMTREFREFLADARDWTQNRQTALLRVFAFESLRFDCDQTEGTIVFSDQGVPKVVADVQFVGSTSSLTRTWLWSWANSSILEPLTAAARQVYGFGEEHGHERLIRPQVVRR